ncbi:MULTISPECIES: serine/threonine-protein kinase [unclassified Streptomyces]|uniref:serine/threonine-protein kinase n=1 Tax=unclassified Streptomyces TaxID=2593676 RepID=UPI00223740DA|nr:serine/threonine-protein kinase [Streptomyces sp. SHP 1-2]MCW5251553.1 protein kinase [Streptomyces sp. SHP 1-2]
MSDNGGARSGPDQPTSFELRPPGPPAAVPHPGNPYAAPTQVAPVSQRVPGSPAPGGSAPPAPDGAGRPPSAPAEPGAGRLIGGRYRLVSKLGHGGMGTVWRAHDETVDREVAVKEPRVPDHLPERERANAFERMRREARAAARLDHPSVVDVHDVTVVDGRPWIVMELVRGRSLGDALQEGTLSAREAARIGLEVLGALEAAHAAGILHRDVKPDNVMLGRYGRVVLTDFGIALTEGETNLTDTGGFVGSPEYIAPERVLGQRPGPASDLWSLGVVLYAATEGVSPFRRSNTPATLQSVLNAVPAPPASAQGPLAEVITGLLEKDPARRPDAARTRALLEAAANPPDTSTTRLAPVPPPAPARRGFRPGRGTWLAVGAAVVAAAVAGYLLLADPWAGPLPDGWKRHDLGGRTGMALAVPGVFTKLEHEEDWDGTTEVFTDPSGMVTVVVDRDVKADDEDDKIPGTAIAKAWAEWDMFKDGEYSRNMADEPAPRGEPKERTLDDRKAAENTVSYTTTDMREPRQRELRVVYYRAGNGDMYQVAIDYPGKGYFADEGRSIARTVIDNWEITKP